MNDADVRRRNHWVNHIARHAHAKPDAVYLRYEGHSTRWSQLDELREWGTGRLARYKLPAVLHIVPSLPRNASGKVMKTVLRRQFGDPRGQRP